MESYYKYQDLLLKPYTSFIYELEIYRSTSDSWNLEESKMYESKTLIKDLVEFSKHDYKNYSLHKFTNLIAAPIKWLQDNAKLIEIETAKEKRKRIADSKIKKENEQTEK